jgi:hypothetical protein
VRLRSLHESLDLEIPREISFQELHIYNGAVVARTDWKCEVRLRTIGQKVVLMLLQDMERDLEATAALAIVEGIGGRRFLEMGRIYIAYAATDLADAMPRRAYYRLASEMADGTCKWDSHCPNAFFSTPGDVLSVKM